MDLQLENHSIVVVGGARGIGRAIAETMAQEKARISLVDVSPSVGQTALEIAERFGVKTTAHEVDVSDYGQMNIVANAIGKMAGKVDHVVFAVGIGSGKYGFPFWNLQPGDWQRVLEINVLGAVHTAHAFVDEIRTSQGTMTFLASVAGQIGSQTDPPYSASKAALINFAQCAAKDLAPYGARVNTICPGMIKTPLNRAVWQAWSNLQKAEDQQSYEDWAAEKIRKVVPLNRWQEPEDVARMVAFLASPLARNITGQTINVDGGFVMHW